MIHMILVILKIVGILLAAVLLLLLALLLLVLFVPLRYRIAGKKYEELKKAEADVRVRWLFGLLEVKFRYQMEKMTADVRILMIKKRLFGESEEKKPKKLKKPKKPKKPEKPEKLENPEKPEESKERKSMTEISETKPLRTEPQKIAFPEAELQKKELPEAELQKTEEKKRFSIPNPLRLVRKLTERLKNLYHRAAKTVRSLKEKWRTLRAYLALLRSEMTKEVWKLCIGYLGSLWRHFKPRKIRGVLHYGMEDPAATGQLTGICYLFLAGMKSVSLQPDFEHKILEGELSITGHIRLVHLLKTGLQIFFNKTLKAYWKRIRQLRRK